MGKDLPAWRTDVTPPEQCVWTAVSPLHPEYPLKPLSFVILLVSAVAAARIALLLLTEALGASGLSGSRRRGTTAKASGQGWVGRAASLVGRGVMTGVLALGIGCVATMLLPAPAQLHTAGGVEGHQHGLDGRPKVVVMMPTRKDLHPQITRKAMDCLHALEHGNPELDISVFLFDKVVPRIPSDTRPLSKVARIRNMMIEEAEVMTKYDYTLWLDSDIVEYPPDLPTRLIKLNPDGVSAPLVLIEEPGPLGTDQFYDTTAFVRRGRSNVSDDPSPYVEGRNIGRFYPYVRPEGCPEGEEGEEGEDAGDMWRCVMRMSQVLDSVGTIYMVSADIFRTGRAVFADHPCFTEHYPLMEHAIRMGREVTVASGLVARHANLPFYGEAFHANVIELGGEGGGGGG